MLKTFLNIDDTTLIREFISENYDLRYNVLSRQVEMSGKPMTERDRNGIFLAARSEFPDMKGMKTILSEILASNFIPEHNPIEDYLSKLPQWDGKDHVAALLDRVPGMDNSSKQWVRIWLRGLVSQWRNDNQIYGNQCVLTLIGSQGCRKSTFLKMLLPESLQSYYLDNINLSNEFSRDMSLSDNLIVNIDEMDQIKDSQQATLKFCISRPVINGRPIYGKTQAVRKRYASFVATTNSPHPLKDATGSRRFLCIQIPDGLKIDVETPIDYKQLYAQIIDEIDNQHLRSWFTDEEVADIQLFNIKFRATSDLSAMLETCFCKPEEDSTAKLLTVKEITGTVTSQFPNVAKEKALDVHIGLLLTKMGYEKFHTRAGNVYNVMPLVA